MKSDLKYGRVRGWLLSWLVVAVAILGTLAWLHSEPRGRTPRLVYTVVEYASTKRLGYLTPADDETSDSDAWPELVLDSSKRTERSTQCSITVARVKVEHLGGAPIAYDSLGEVPEVFCNTWRNDGTRRRILDARHFSGGFGIMAKGDSRVFSVDLPAQTTAWQVGFTAWRASRRHQVARVLGPVVNRVPGSLWSIIPNPRRIDVREYWSEKFEILKQAPDEEVNFTRQP